MPQVSRPICGNRLGRDWIDAGTNARTQTSAPSDLFAAPNRKVVQIARDVPSRLLLAAQCGLSQLPAAVKARLAPLLTYRTMAVMAGCVVAVGLANVFGVGLLVDVVLGVTMVAVLGSDAIHAGRKLSGFYKLAVAARTQSDFEAAGNEFAAAVSVISIDVLLALLTRARPVTEVGSEAGLAGKAAMEESWAAYANRVEFNVPRDKGMLWTKLAAPQEAGAMRNAERIARSKGLTTLEMILKDEGFYELYAKQFGSYENIQAKGLEAVTAKIWKLLSERYAMSLEGKVTAYVHDENLSRALMGGKEPFFVDEMSGIADAMEANSRITSVEVIDATTGRSQLMLRSEVLRAAKLTH